MIGVLREKRGETPRAFVVREAGSTLTEEQIIAETRRLVGGVKNATGVEFVESLRKSGVGKVLRRVIHDQFWKGATHGIAGA